MTMIPPRRHFAQPQQATRINWKNPITRRLRVALNLAEASHDSVVNLVSGNRWTGSVATAPEKGVGIHGKWQARGNSDGNYWQPNGETFSAVPCSVVALCRDFNVTGNRFVAASFGASPSAADWVGFETTPAPVTNFASGIRTTGFGTYMANDAVYGWDVKETDYRIYQRGRVTATGGGSAGTPQLSAVGGTGAGFSTYPARMYLFLYWDRVLTEGEHLSLAFDPWQVFAPSRGFIKAGGVSLEPRYGRPTLDISAGGWTPSSGSDLYAMVDESVASDADYISTTSASTCEFGLTALADPGTSIGHVLKIRMKSDTSESVRVSIRQGASTEIAAFTQAITATPTTYEFTLSGAQIDAITNYTDLRLRIEGL